MKRRTSWQDRERREMARMLVDAGFSAQCVDRLVAEGMGPEELAARLRRPSGAVGSLEYTHNFKRRSAR